MDSFLFCLENWDVLKNFAESYDHKPGIYKDIIDGIIYQTRSAEVQKDGYFPIILYWHIDGAPAFRSKNISIWPIQSFIVELPQT